MTDLGKALDDEVIARLFTLHGRVVGPVSISDEALTNLTALTRQRQSIIQRDISERNARFFTEESDKLEGWADDLNSDWNGRSKTWIDKSGMRGEARQLR